MEYIHYIIIGLILSVCLYFIFNKKDTFINRKLENFEGDDLNVHYNNDLNVINDDSTIIE
jgi:hypothetical protein